MVLIGHAFDIFIALAIGVIWFVVLSLPFALDVPETSRGGKTAMRMAYTLIVIIPAIAIVIGLFLTLWSTPFPPSY